MRSLFRRVAYLLGRRRLDADLAEEMTFHRDMAAQELERAGLEPVDASLAARRVFGSTAWAADRARDVWIPAAVRDVSHDVRFALRLFIKNPSFAAVAVVILALSIGFNATLFTIVDGMGGGDPPIDRPEHVAALGSIDPTGRP